MNIQKPFHIQGGTMKSKSLIQYLDELSDKRRAEGKRHKQSFVLLIVLMATMSGSYGYRGINRFVKKNANALIKNFEPIKDRLPSLATIRRVIMNIDFNEFTSLFKKWAMEDHEITEGSWISIDGKCLKNTLTDYSKPYQNFVSIVSAYVHNSGQVISVSRYENKKISEIEIVRKMIDSLGLQGVTFSMDALHCKKNS